MQIMQEKKDLVGVIIGAGHFADIQLEAWESVNGAKIKGVLSRTKNKAETLAQKYSLSVYDDFDQMINELKPDFVDICTPPDSHFQYVKWTADRGIAILCQKPVAPTWEETLELIKYQQEKNVPFMINENWRWQAWYREIKHMINQNMLGKVYNAYFAMRPGDGWGESPYPVQPYFKEMKEFLIFETGVHFIDTYRYLFGEIQSVYCQTKRINPIIEGEDMAIAHFNFVNDMTAIYDANRTTYMEEVRTPVYGWMTVEGTEGKLRLEEDGSIYYTPRNGKERRHEYVIPKGWKGGCAVATQQHFINGIREGIPYESSGEQYLKSVRVVYACYESARRMQVISL
jgi:predicted dehydrogenase